MYYFFNVRKTDVIKEGAISQKKFTLYSLISKKKKLHAQIWTWKTLCIDSSNRKKRIYWMFNLMRLLKTVYQQEILYSTNCFAMSLKFRQICS